MEVFRLEPELGASFFPPDTLKARVVVELLLGTDFPRVKTPLGWESF